MDSPTPEATPQIQVYISPPSPFKKILKISAVFLGIVILILALILTLNYFNILSLSSLFPAQFGFLPHQNLNFKNPLIEKAKSLGYTITYIDPKDTAGRTVFYDWRGAYGNGGIGLKEIKNPDGTGYIRHVTGLFQSFKEIPNSSDKYLLLTNPLTQEALPPLRLVLTQNESSVSGTPHFPLTGLFVEDLSALANNTNSFASLGQMKNLKDADLRTLLQKGDTVAAYLASHLIKNQQGTVRGKNIKDDKGNFSIFDLYLRRFGGEAQIEKELGKSLPLR